jgi:hypothetical protein
MGLPEGQVIEQAYVILLKLDKNKEVLVRNDWGKIGRTSKFNGSKSLLNMTLFLRTTSGWVVSFTGLITMVLAKPSTFGVMLPIHRISVVICSRGVILKVSTVSHPLPYIILHPFMIATLNHMSQFVFTSTKIISSVPCH